MPADKDYDALAATLHAHEEPMKHDTTEDGEKKAAESPASLLVDFMRARCRLVHYQGNAKLLFTVSLTADARAAGLYLNPWHRRNRPKALRVSSNNSCSVKRCPPRHK